MFQTIGRHIDPDAGVRRRRSAGVLGSAGVAASAFLVLLGLRHVDPPALPPAADDVVIFPVVTQDPDPAFSAPEPPSAPSPPQKGESERTKVREAQPEKDFNPDHTPTEVPKVVKPEIKPTRSPAGAAGGIDGATATGIGDADGSSSGRPAIFHRSQLALKRHPDPRYPSTFTGSASQRCEATVQINPEGIPISVDVFGCEEAFRQATHRALMRWRWHPPRLGGRSVHAQTRIAVNFRPGQ